MTAATVNSAVNVRSQNINSFALLMHNRTRFDGAERDCVDAQCACARGERGRKGGMKVGRHEPFSRG